MKRKSKKTVRVIFELNARLQPSDRYEFFEEPLEEMLDEYSLGEVIGGGTKIKKECEIESCSIELDVYDYNLEKLKKISNLFQELDVPKGSKVIVPSEKIEYPFGIAEGLAIYIDYAELDDGVYQSINDALDEDGQLMSIWDTDTETVLYIYGASYKTMCNKIKAFLDSNPLFNKHRLAQIA